MGKLGISVIMAAYNSEKYIEESIKSILNQTFYNLELIIVNDASKDNSLNIIERYQKIDERIRVLTNNENIGPAASRNRGLKLAKGKYIAILDSDDISLPKRLEKQYQFLEENPEIFLCGTGIVSINEDGEIMDIPKTIVSYKKIEKTLIKRNCISHSTIMFRNEANFYREKFIYAQDYDFYLTLLSKGLKLDNLDDVLVKYRSTTGNITFSKRNKQNLFADQAKKFYIQRLKYGKDKYEYFDYSTIIMKEDKSPNYSLSMKYPYIKKLYNKIKYSLAKKKYQTN